MGKKIFVFFLIMVLVISPVSVYASSAGSVVVAGGSIATGGLASGYAEKTEKTAITLTMALLYSLGVTTHLTQEAISAGQSAYGYVKSLFSEWVSGSSAEQMSASDREELKRRFSVINGGGNIDPTGNIFLNGTALDLFRRFVNWCKQTGKIGDSSVSQDYQTGSINGISTIYSSELRDDTTDFWYICAYTDYNYNIPASAITDPANVLWYKIYYGSKISFQAVSTEGPKKVFIHVCKGDKIYTGGLPLYARSNGYYSNGDNKNRDVADLYPQAAFANDASYTGSLADAYATFFGGGDGTLGVDGNTGSSLPDGLVHDGDVDTSFLDNPDNNQTVINPGLLPTIADDNPGKEYQVSADDYLEAIRQILNQKTNPADVPEQLPVTDVPTGVTVPVDIPADQPADWPITTPSSPTATPDVPTGSTPVVDPATPADPETSMPKLTFPLDEYFPFCIPFDVYALLSKFSAEPVTPVFDVGFTEPFSNSEVNLHIDLTPWNGVATAIRTAELGAFIVGLALLSKQIFTRG